MKSLGIWALVADIAPTTPMLTPWAAQPHHPLARLTPAHPARALLGLLLVLSLLAALQQLALDHLNNYYIFTRPLRLWLEGHDPYSADTKGLFWDTFKYSPSFLLVVGWLSFLPDGAGVLLWNALTAAVLATGLLRACKDPRLAWWAGLIVALEAMTAFQNLQSNPLLAGLMLHAYADHREGRPGRAALWAALAGFIKIYGIAVAAVFLTKSTRWRAYAWLATWMFLLTLIPFAASGSWSGGLTLYQAWFMTVGAYTTVVQLSAMGLWQAWTGLELPFRPVQFAALLLTVAPLLRWRRWQEQTFQLLLLASLMSFVVVFNQVAESPVYVIALTGIAVVSVCLPLTRLDAALLVAALVITSLLTTDLLPVAARTAWYEPLKLKVLPVLLIWLRLQWRLWGRLSAMTSS